MAKNPTRTKSKITFLKTVYPPISNQEAMWAQSIPEVEAQIRTSDFYMIAGRAEAKYRNFVSDSDKITFDFTIGDDFSDSVTLNIRELPKIKTLNPTKYWLEFGEKIVFILDRPSKEPDAVILEWFTTEKLIWERSHGCTGISGFNKYHQAATYDLLYVGIAKVGDSFDRLFKRGHKARMDILSNETQRYPGARVSDEIYLFLFKAEPLIAATFELDHDFQEEDIYPTYDSKRIVADAEKAFVHLLKPEYNLIKFHNYPKGIDGLYQSDYDRYGYAINECFSFNTAHGRIRGSLNPLTGFITNDGDVIFIDGDEVKLYLSGVDFPGGEKSFTDEKATET